GAFDEWRRQQVLAIRTVEHKEESIAACLCEKLPLSSVELRIEQDRRLHRIPIMGVVGRDLVTPRYLSRIDVQGHDRAGPEIIPFPRVTCVYRIWIARTPVNEV